MRSEPLKGHGFSRAVRDASGSYQGTTSVVPLMSQNLLGFSPCVLKGHGFSRAVTAAS